MAKLIITDGPGAGQSYLLDSGELVIGRDTVCEVSLADVKVSRRHAVLRAGRGGCTIEDLGSSNGTYLNDKVIGSKKVALADGDVIRIGQSVLLFSGSGIDVFEDQDTIIQTFDSGVQPLFDDLEKEGGAQALRFLLDLAREAESAGSIAKLAEVLIDGLEVAVKADRVMLFTGRNSDMRVVECKLNSQKKEMYSLPHSTTVVAKVAAEKVAVMSRIADDERFKNAESIADFHISSAICVPLLGGDELLGVVYLDRINRTQKFNSYDLDLCSAAALQCSMALMSIKRLGELRESRDRLEAELNGPDGFIGKAESLRNTYDFIAKVAPTDAGVLILGESGTGKELVSRAIHKQSARVDKPFVIVNCAALAESLAEAELFGHERGAFTGADKSRPGRFLAADGGTIFLDEVGELSEPIQAKLLRVLESGEVTPVGEAGVRNIDVRVIAATNRDLAQEVEKGTFRRDLYYRLNILQVHLPPLRERVEDIPLLVEHFVRFLGARCGKTNLKISEPLMKKCQSYAWPGNVRELKNTVERMVILCSNDTLEESDLPQEITGARAGAVATSVGGMRALADVEREHIASVLKELEGNKKKAAEVLGIDRSTLYAKIKSYDIV